jgi:hypothetical protein
MSEYSEIETKFKDEKALCEALGEMGFSKDQVEIHKEAANLYGYHGDKRSTKANIIIRRKDIGSASNDVGFIKKPNGMYEAIISDYDSRRFNKKWVGNLSGHYADKLLTRKLRASGHELKRVEKVVNGKKVVVLVGIK